MQNKFIKKQKEKKYVGSQTQVLINRKELNEYF